MFICFLSIIIYCLEIKWVKTNGGSLMVMRVNPLVDYNASSILQGIQLISVKYWNTNFQRKRRSFSFLKQNWEVIYCIMDITHSRWVYWYKKIHEISEDNSNPSFYTNYCYDIYTIFLKAPLPSFNFQVEYRCCI
jgi:hypothetical protein